MIPQAEEGNLKTWQRGFEELGVTERQKSKWILIKYIHRLGYFEKQQNVGV